MNIENLKIGNTYNNYRILCSVLGIIPKKGGESRQLQVSDFNRYFKYKRDGQAYTILDIFEEPVKKIDGRSFGNNRKTFANNRKPIERPELRIEDMPNEDYWKEKLTYLEFSTIARMVDYINPYDNALKVGEKFLSSRELAELIDEDVARVRRVITGLIAKNAMCRYSVNIYDDEVISVMIINPTIRSSDELKSEFAELFLRPELIEINNTKFTKIDGRNTPEYREWIRLSLERDNNTCQCCGSTINPEVHHLQNFATNKALRTDLNNSITLCQPCHSPVIKGSFHSVYGTRNNTKEQVEEYIGNKRKELGIA